MSKRRIRKVTFAITAERAAELKAEAAALREALEEIKDEAEGDFDRDIILTACNILNATDAGRPLLERLRQVEEQLAICMTEIQTAHGQIDQWNFGISTHDEERELSLSERISDLCRRLARAEAERDDLQARLLALAGMSKVIE